VSLVVGMTVRFLDPAIFLEILRVVSRWLVDPYPGQTGQLSLKEGVLLCQRLGMLERMVAIADPGLRATFESSFVQLVQKLCSAPQVPKVRLLLLYRREMLPIRTLLGNNEGP
ncbi:hypothetical protein DUNSADRAFT_6305, partial [Dunaliella salina]